MAFVAWVFACTPAGPPRADWPRARARTRVSSLFSYLRPTGGRPRARRAWGSTFQYFESDSLFSQRAYGGRSLSLRAQTYRCGAAWAAFGRLRGREMANVFCCATPEPPSRVAEGQRLWVWVCVPTPVAARLSLRCRLLSFPKACRPLVGRSRRFALSASNTEPFSPNCTRRTLMKQFCGSMRTG